VGKISDLSADYAGMPLIPLLKALTGAGVGSRRQMADAIRQGRVEVDGNIAEDLRLPLDVETASVLIDGRPVILKPAQTLYLLLNKPVGVLSTTKDDRGRRTVIDILPPKYRHQRLYPVGRLDKNSTGLLLLTNDGDITHKLTHPGFEHEKEYLVAVNVKLREHAKRSLQQGIKLDDGITCPAIIKEVAERPFNYSITIHEGRKHQVRRMFEYLGYRILALKRIRMGSIKLGDLEPGAVRKLSLKEVQALRSSTGNLAARENRS